MPADAPVEFDTTQHAVADTGVMGRFTKVSADSEAYSVMLGERRLAISFQTEAELLTFPLGEKRTKQLQALLAATLKLPHSLATSVKYAVVTAARTELRARHLAGEGTDDGDMWVLSSAMEYGLPVLSHDADLVCLGRHLDHAVLTNLPVLRDANPAI
jgi:predicted nucleic acid-binding protein